MLRGENIFFLQIWGRVSFSQTLRKEGVITQNNNNTKIKDNRLL